MMRGYIYCTIAISALNATAAYAVDLEFDGLVENSCVLTIDTAGILAPSADGTQLNSELGTGISAVVAVAALGTSPTVSVGQPVATEPVGQASGSITEIRYTSLGGESQAYTNAASTAPALLVDAFTFDARISNGNGFVAGNYNVTSQVTCSQ